MPTVRTTFDIESGLASYGIEVEIEYSYYAGYRGSRMEPPESEIVTIEGATILDDGERFPAPWLAGMLDTDAEVLSLCLLDYHERRIDAAEQRAEAMREERMMRGA